MYTIDVTGDLVGFSIWSADPHYTPLVGCYRDGRLEYFAECDLRPQKGLAGPSGRCWFRMAVSGRVRESLRSGDPTVRLLRCEDALPLAMDGATPRALNKVEDFLTSASQSMVKLAGFSDFLAAPAKHQLDILFLDYLDRLPDPAAREHYLDKLNGGSHPLSLRAELLVSEEFGGRQPKVSERIGSLITSPMWQILARSEALGETRVPLREFKIGDNAGLSDEEFVERLSAVCPSAYTNDVPLEALVLDCREQGRAAFALTLVREAAVEGRFVRLLDA